MMHRTTLVAVAALLGSLLAVEPARAELRPAPAFGPHMVLQSQAEVPVWGVAEAGQEVAVRFAGQAVKAKADGQGHWRAILKPMDASAEGRTLMIAAGDETVELEGVVVGEVWIHVGPGGGEAVLVGENEEDVGPGGHGGSPVRGVRYATNGYGATA